MWGRVPLAVVLVFPGVLANTGGGVSVDPVQIANFGMLGLMFYFLVTGKFLVARRELDAANAVTDRMLLERNEAQAEVREKNDLIQGRYVPALEAARIASESILDFIKTGVGK